MASTFTSNLGITLPANGDLDGVWGDTVNTNMDILDRAVNGVLSLSLSGTASTLTTTDGALSDGQYKLLVLAGSPTGTHTITISPNDADKIYFVRNTTAQSVVFTQGTGGNVTIATGDSGIIYANGGGTGAAVANITDHFAMNSVAITGGTITGITDLAIADGGTGASSASAARTNLGLGTGDSPAFAGLAVDTNTLYVDSVSNNVGIGTASPTARLQVVGSSTSTADTFLAVNTGNNDGSSYLAFGDSDASNVGHIQYAHDTDSMWFRVNSTTRLAIDSAGLIGMGTTAPAAALDISGTTNGTASGTACSISGNTLTVGGTLTGTWAVGDRVWGSGVDFNTVITALGTGTGGAGTYTLNNSMTVASTTMYAIAASKNVLRFTNTDTTEQAYQTEGGIEFYGADASTPGAGVKGYIATIAESGTPDTAMVFGTSDNVASTQALERLRIGPVGQIGFGGANWGTAGQTVVSGGSAAAPAWGTLPVGGGGTGASTLTGYVKGNGTLAMTASATIPNTDITGLGTMSTQASSAVSITGGTITGITDLAIADGGTGSSTAAGALLNLGVTATAAELNLLDGVIATTAEINFLDTVSSNIQTQLNAKAPLASPTFTGTATIPVANITTNILGNAADSATAPTFTWSGDTNNGIFRPAADVTAITTAGVERLRVAAAGQIGIGGATYGTDGQALKSGGASAAPTWGNVIDYQVFTASGTWTKPSGVSADATVIVELWGAGGGGSRNASSCGGGGGAYSSERYLASSLSATVAVTVGSGGAGATVSGNSGGVGGDSSFGSYITAYGGGGGGAGTNPRYGGVGGGHNKAGATDTQDLTNNGGGQPGGSNSSGVAQDSTFPDIWGGGGGGGGSSSTSAAKEAVFGGGGGGSAYSTTAAAGTSKFGGNGGTGNTATGGSGTAPGGGGGAGTSAGGAGARGEVRVWVIG